MSCRYSTHNLSNPHYPDKCANHPQLASGAFYDCYAASLISFSSSSTTTFDADSLWLIEPWICWVLPHSLKQRNTEI